jgi:hypothetical protein
MPRGRNQRNRKTQRRRKSRRGGGNNNFANTNGMNMSYNPTPNFVASNIHRPEPNNLLRFNRPSHNIGLNGVLNSRKRFTRQNGHRNLRQVESNAVWANAFASPPIGKKTWKNWMLGR